MNIKLQTNIGVTSNLRGSLKEYAYLFNRLPPALLEKYKAYLDASNDCPFWYGEQAQIGFLIQALCKEFEKEKGICLQEFGAYIEKTGEYKGKGDLYFDYKHNNRSAGILIEAKYHSTSSRSDYISSKYEYKWKRSHLESAFGQAKNYFDAEETYYHDDILILSIIFESFRIMPKSVSDLDAHLDKYDEWMKMIKNVHENEYISCGLILNIEPLSIDKHANPIYLHSASSVDSWWPAMAIHMMADRPGQRPTAPNT